MDEQMVARQATKTVEHHFMQTLIEEFRFSPREAQGVLAEAKASLMAVGKEAGRGQIRVILTQRRAGHGQALVNTANQEVLWTIDAGAEDQQILTAHGREALRRARIVRLLDEALDQGAAATQEDLALALNVGLRTVKRDCKELAAQGVYLPTRGNLQGIGRGQTHKALIVGRWLRGETYDQLMLSTRHSLNCIRRYIQSFVRIVELHEQGFSLNQIGRLVEHSETLVQEYLAVYHQNDSPACRERLAEQLTRFGKAAGRSSEPKRGAQ